MTSLLSKGVYHCTRGLVRIFYRRPRFERLENLPDGPCVIVGNHTQMHGPIIAELYIPGDRAVWCNSEMMTLAQVPDYAFQDFWSDKPVSVRWLFRLLSYAIAPLSVCIFNNAKCVPVYHDARVMTTFRETVKRLSDGQRIVIFPESDPPHNEIIYELQDRFIDLGYMFHRQTGKALAFVPMYIAPALKSVVFGEPLFYDAAALPGEERERLREGLIDAITHLARSLPRHRVVPFRNMPKNRYPMSQPEEEATK